MTDTAPEIVRARIEGMLEAINIVAGNVAAASEYLSTENAMLLLRSLATSVEAIRSRISTLQADLDKEMRP